MTSPNHDQSIPLVTFYQSFNNSGNDLPLNDIFQKIQTGEYEASIGKIRSYEKSGEYKKRDNLKKRLPAFTPTATFSGSRKTEFLQQYSGVIHLDFDKIPREKVDEVSQKIIAIPYTFACFRSPSGKGLKVFIKVSSGSDEHPTAYNQILEFYESSLGINADPKCKDITRLCFVSSDPNMYINQDAPVFQFKVEESGGKFLALEKPSLMWTLYLNHVLHSLKIRLFFTMETETTLFTSLAVIATEKVFLKVKHSTRLKSDMTCQLMR